MVPVVVGIEPQRGLGVLGDREAVLASARWLVIHSSTTYGPADLTLALMTTADRLIDWDWVKWLPALAFVATTAEELAAGLARWSADEGAPPMLLVVDGHEPDGPGDLARVVAGTVSEVRLLWLGDRIALPAACSHVMTVAADRRFELVDLMQADQSRRRTEGWAELLDAGEAVSLAHQLAPFDDPERNEPAARLPSSVPLVQPGDLQDGLRRAWHEADRSTLVAPIGADTRGAVEIDLVADGPHALVAGTTGAGKSELLRSLVAGLALRQPPDLVSFVLIDFKGGGAFDAVGRLPHVAAVVTDLDAHEAARALRSLRAELADRERRLRTLAASDLAEVPVDVEGGFPRLVVVVDEFAALASELPDFLDGLVDIARRGRSLGVHLILATQRPAAIVTGQIRANTNLRICLRVQDRADSLDVVDRPDAADLPAIAGRAVLRVGSGPLRHLQVAHLGTVDEPVSIEPFVAHEKLLSPGFGGDEIRRRLDVLRAVSKDAIEAGPPVDSIRCLTAATRRLADELAMLRPEPPWLPQLRAVTSNQMRESIAAGSAAPAIGLLDDPDNRCRRTFVWDDVNDGLLILAANSDELESSVVNGVVAVIEAALARAEPVPAVYVLDGGSTGLDRLGQLPVVADVVSISDGERLAKAVLTLSRQPRTDGGDRPTLLVVHGWASVADSLHEEAGPDAAASLVRLVRRSGGRDLRVIVSGTSDRDVPSRVTSHLHARVLHRLADPGAYLSFGLRSADVPSMSAGEFIDPTTALAGVICRRDLDDIGQLSDRLRALAPANEAWPEPVRVLGERVARTDLPRAEMRDDVWLVPIGLDGDLGVRCVRVGAGHSIVVIGQPGTGRSTALETIRTSLPAQVEPVVIDDGERMTEADVAPLLRRAVDRGVGLVIACTPQAARAFGGWLGPLMGSAQVVLLNPSRVDGDVCRASVPDLSRAPIGRAVLVDRGLVSLLQVAA